MKRIFQSVGLSIRRLRKNPGFALISILTIAFGIGTMTAVFSLVYAILLRPFPYPDGDRLVSLRTVNLENGAERGCSLLDLEDYRRLSTTLSAIGAYTISTTQLHGDGAAQAIRLGWVNPEALDAVGAQPLLGRLFRPEEDRAGGDVFKALLSYSLWRSRYGSDPGILGRTVHTPITSFTVIGVMPAGFEFPEGSEMWVPMESWYALKPRETAVKQRGQFWYSTIARLKPGASQQEAGAEMAALSKQLEELFPNGNRNERVHVISLRDHEVGDLRPYLLLLTFAGAFFLLICCVNNANLLITNAIARQLELALRSALGAGRRQLALSLLGDALLLSLLACPLGLLVAMAGVRGLEWLVPVPLPNWMQVEIDSAVLLSAIGFAFLVALAAGAVPAWQTSRTDLQGPLRSGPRGTSGNSRLRSALMVVEVALCLPLLVGAGLMMTSFVNLTAVDPGFQREGLLVVRVSSFLGGGTRMDRAAALSDFYSRVLANLTSIPGVSAAAASNQIPYMGTESGRAQTQLLIRGQAEEGKQLIAPLTAADVSSNYFDVMGIPLLEGRSLRETDTDDSACVVLVNARAARSWWPDRDPVGQEVLYGELTDTNPYCRVVGVVGDVKQHSAEAENGIELYYSFRQWPVNNPYFLLRVNGKPSSIASAARQAVHQVDPNTAIVFIKSLDEMFEESLWQRRLWGVAFGFFAMLALILAAGGIYGVLSHSALQRRREVGIRMALGARPGQILGLLVLDGLRLTLLGGVAGTVGAFALTRFMSGMLFGISALDPRVFLGVAGLLLACALAASAIPARRAARVDPLIALRQD